jgi:hypothetical protein
MENTMKRIDYLELLKKVRFLITIIIVAFVFVACASSSDDDDDNAGVTDLEGTWVSSCVPNDSENDQESSIRNYVFSGSTFALFETWYNDATCTAVRDGYPQSFEGTFTIGESVTTTDGIEAKQLSQSIAVDGETVSWVSIYVVDSSTLTVSCIVNDCSATEYPTEMGIGVTLTKQ